MQKILISYGLQGEHTGGVTLSIKGIPYSIILYSKNSPDVRQDQLHELEHDDQHLIKSGYQNYLLEVESGQLLLPDELKKHRDKPEFLVRAKGELLAFFTTFEFIVDHKVINEKFERVRNVLNKSTVDCLTDNSERGVYYPGYVKQYGAIDYDYYTQQITNAVQAINSLFNIYMNEYKNANIKINPARMAINVMNQFPLTSWPAVAKLILKNHSS